MSRNLALYLDDILSSIEKIERYTAKMDRDSFIADERTIDAVSLNLQIIGEAVKKVPPERMSEKSNHTARRLIPPLRRN
jgi:uncharacterized protein with HEPN domain